MKKFKYVCTVDMSARVTADADDYDSAFIEALYQVVTEMRSDPVNFLEKNLSDARCHLVERVE